MTSLRSLALAASLLAGSALPALAQTAMPDPAPATPSALPDTSIKKAAPGTRARHASHHHQHAKTTVPTPPAHAG